MIKRTLFFSSSCHLNVKDKQLIITNKDTGELNQTPIEDIGFIILDNPAITFTQSVIQELSENNSAVVFCNKKHHPSSLLFHLDTHQIQTELFSSQINASEPLKKQLWQYTIKAKIRNQALLLKTNKKETKPLDYFYKKVKSGDPDNYEAQAARIYWKNLFNSEFKRERFGEGANYALNYGYAILRAAVARSLSGSGLLSTLGIHHKNRYNSFCLADDIMEPYRPFVDKIVYDNLNEILKAEELNKEIKIKLLNILSMDILINKKKSPLMVGLTQTTASLAHCFKGTAKRIKYPELI